jgi:hypothetical protein
MGFRTPAAVAIALLCIAPAAAPAAGQAPDRLRVFVECGWCDQDFLRTELTWVDYMRDRADAHVHVLVTRQTTAGGGGLFTLEFIGARDFAGQVDTLQYTSGPNDSQDTRRRGLAQVIKLGLVPFAARTGMAERLNVTLATPPAGATPGAAGAAVAAEAPPDPWNFWTFRVGFNGNSNGESNQGSSSLSGSVTANRTTADWKINLGTNGSYNESRFEYAVGGQTVKTTSIRRNYGGNALLVRSVTPHLSLGARASANTSTFGNTRLSLSLMPAVEYNIVPYAQSTRRSFTILYAAGVRHADYREITWFDEVEETRPQHTLGVSYTTRQPWGNVNVGLNGSQYLHDTGKYSAGLGGSTDLRLFRGFSFNVGGNYSRVRDQLHLPRRNLTEQEILLRQRAMATNYNYFIFGGISYRFGSIFSNVVNPRMGGGGSGGEGIMIMM